MNDHNVLPVSFSVAVGNCHRSSVCFAIFNHSCFDVGRCRYSSSSGMNFEIVVSCTRNWYQGFKWFSCCQKSNSNC